MNTQRFTVALSFPGEHRDFVSKVASNLADKLGKSKVLYDRFHEAEFARPNLDIHLPNLYRTQSDLIVIFLCAEYATKRWCNLEWRFIRQLISTANEDRIMFLSFDEVGAIPEMGILSGDGYAVIGDRSPEDIAALILQRLGPLTDEPHDHVSLPASFLAKPDEVPRELKCCVLITEALSEASWAAGGGSRSTFCHRRLDAAHRWMNEGCSLLTESRDALGFDLADLLGRICSDSLPLLIAEARRALPPPGEVDQVRRDNEYLKEAQRLAAKSQDELSGMMKKHSAFVVLADSNQKWPILGFLNKADYRDFLDPSVQTVARNADPMQRDLFVRLLDQPTFSPFELREEGYHPALVLDTVNALIKENWAKWTEKGVGLRVRGTLTPVGQRLLRQLIAHPAPTQPSASPTQLAIWQEKLAFLLTEEAIVSDAAQKFTLKKQIAEAQAKIRELER